jgi:hypothetical protein
LIRRKHEITVDDHADRKAWSDRERRLDVEIASNNLLAGLIEAIATASPQCPNDIAIGAVRPEFRTNAE